ncbi:MAG TPA: YkgJ family cysteine cluster protein [Gammaproteobacteria bacterium]|nr:YkgJ family cysteine cluster protein [Gammaproteobacteria bacterium]
MSDEKDYLHPDEFGNLGINTDSAVVPVYLGKNDKFKFNCYPGISCFNECCRNIDIVLTPYDVLRLKNNLGITTTEFIANFTNFYEVDGHGLPGLNLKTKDDMKACEFLTEGGCAVYEDRPTACRYYALGNMAMRKKDSGEAEIGYFVVKEDHCKGHLEDKEQTVAEYRHGQGLEEYDEMNFGFQELVLKKKSSGPTVGAPSPRSMQLYFLATYDMDRFREFIKSPGFMDVFDLPAEEYEKIISDELELLNFSQRFLKQVLFGENTIVQKENAADVRMQKKQQRMSRKQKELNDQAEGKA